MDVEVTEQAPYDWDMRPINARIVRFVVVVDAGAIPTRITIAQSEEARRKRAEGRKPADDFLVAVLNGAFDDVFRMLSSATVVDQ